MTTVVPVTEFDVCGALPDGVTVLEASAGTGKTYTIAALAARYVAAGLPLERMLLITFTRMATGELRDRVRERLVTSEHQLARILAGEDPRAARSDEITTLLADGTTEEVERRRHRLARAVADFDAATIATTHGFCQEVLAELGTIGDLEPGTEFVEDVSDLLEEVLDDLYVRRFHWEGAARFNRAEAIKIARAAVFNPMARLEPRDEPYGTNAAMRYRLAQAVCAEIALRKRRLAIMTYDDLLTRLNDTLAGPNAEEARERLRRRYDVVLVDEFQDTDPIQWQILHRSFVHEASTLVLIADPKQAIYAFRGADVYAYLMAAKTAQTRATLQVNRRSDQPLLDAYDALFDDARLGHEGIVYRRIRAADEHQLSRLTGAPDAAALRVRVVHRDEPGIEQTYNGYAQVTSVREHIAADLAQDVVRLLSSEATVEAEPVQPGHIAVLVRTHTTAELIREHLGAAGVPAVINGAGTVFATPSAKDWLRLLEAIERPASTLRAKTAALTPFLGWSAERVAAADEQEWEQVHRRLHRWSRVLRERGVAALAEAIMLGENLPSRVLAVSEGERRLTDLRHLAQLLHRAASAERLGVTALRGWLAQRIAAAEREEAEDERTRRLESDADAVQVLTIHRSKGLEFPIVYCPFLWDPTWIRTDEPVFFHDPAAGDERTIDVGLDSPSFRRHLKQHRAEQRGEDLRLAYVALTRAKHRAVIWWAGSKDSRNSALHRLLFCKDEHGDIDSDGRATPTDADAAKRFEALASQAPGRIGVERSTLGLPTMWSRPLAPPAELRAAEFRRELDLRWRRTSYTDITSAAHDALVASEPEEPILTDEPEAPAPAPATAPAPERPAAFVAESPRSAEDVRPTAPPNQPSPMVDLPVGVKFGTFVHSVLEATDFTATDLDAELTRQVDAVQQRRYLDLSDRGAAIGGLRVAIETPLGPLLDQARLRDVRRSDRLDELEFELPLVGGDDPSGRLTLGAVAAALREHLEPGDPLAAYATRLEDPALRATVRGFLTGSIDLVIRLDGPRFAIVDYKTNWLGALDEPLTLNHYRPGALEAEMNRAHYGLQALLYTVALHRYLRWRQPGYAPDRQLAGVMYLFLRGMAGAEAPRAADGSPFGVFTWRAPARLVETLSDVLDHGGGG